MIASWQQVDTPLGPTFIAASEVGLLLLRLDTPVDTAMAELASLLAERVPLGDSIGMREGGDFTHTAAEQVEQYFARVRLDLDVPLDQGASTRFQSAVRAAVRAIPAGQTRTYGEVAEAAGYPGAARAVGNVMRENPVQLAVPCHRVVASDGLGGYGHRDDLKRWLLQHEGVALP